MSLNTFFLKGNYSTFYKSVLSLSLGNIAGQVIGFLALPFLGRIYSPQEYGLYSAFIGVCQTVILISTLKYDKAILLPDSNDKSKKIILMTGLIVFVYAIIVLCVILFASFFDMIGILGKYIYLIPLAILCFGSLSLLTNWLQRKSRFKHISILFTVQSALTVLLSIIFGLYQNSINGLIMGWTLGCILLLIFYVVVTKVDFGKFTKFWDYTSFKKIFKEYIHFPKYFLPYDLLSSGMIFIIPAIISYLFSETDSGLYSMSYRILFVPFIVVSSSISNVFIVDANKQYNESQEFKSLYKRTLIQIVPLGLLIYSLTYFFGEFIIVHFLGKNWQGIESYVQIISIWLFFEFVAVVFKSSTYIVTQQQKKGLRVQLLNTICSLGLLLLFSKFGIYIALIAFTASAAIFCVYNLYLTYKLASNWRSDGRINL